EFILAGSSAVQIGSAVGENWIQVFDEINNGISKYMEKKGFSKIEDMIGRAKKS
ncbi:MAG: dihydroorotate dehydrogenase, partial [Thaumarchaeota archaeon]|nr:dihydroorotate dehydrogenase [Nitrososphaerota archaeon]